VPWLWEVRENKEKRYVIPGKKIVFPLSLFFVAALLGTVIASPLSGFLCSQYGWPSVFYILGGIGLGMSIAVAFLGSDYPSTHRMISQAERQFIESSLGGAKEKVKIHPL